jgi:hypothetical protein
MNEQNVPVAVQLSADLLQRRRPPPPVAGKLGRVRMQPVFLVWPEETSARSATSGTSTPHILVDGALCPDFPKRPIEENAQAMDSCTNEIFS